MELLRALGALAEPPGPAHARIAEALGLPDPPDGAEHTELFGFQLVPYASVYLGPEGMLGGEARDRIAGFWQAIGELPPHEPDHLTVQLGLLATLAEHENQAPDAASARLLRHGRHAFLREHVASWLGVYLQRVEEIATPFYGTWAGLLRSAIRQESDAFRAAADFTEALPTHLKDAAPLSSTDDMGLDELVATLLTPARSGGILCRADLRRIGDEVGFSARIGERRATLKALVQQDAAAALERLGDEFERQARARASDDPDLVEQFWRRRAMQTAGVLRGAGRDARFDTTPPQA
jgi:hypothetical protein